MSPHKSNRSPSGFVIPIMGFLGACLMVLSIGGLFAYVQEVKGQESSESKEQVEERREELRNRLNSIEAQINKNQEILKDKKKERISIERDIDILEAEIEQARLEIRRRNIIISRLSDQIQQKQQRINELEGEMGEQKEVTAELLRNINKIDDFTLVEIILRNEDFADFFRKIDALRGVSNALNDSIDEMKEIKKVTQQKKEDLKGDKQEQVELRKVQELQKRKIEQKESKKQKLLQVAKQQERQYEQVIEEKQKTAAEIRSELFTLRDSAAIPFGKAYRLARQASEETGVRPAFLLGILAEESNIGEYMGDGVWREDMKPSRDKPVFEAMAREIGFDPDEMPVSQAPSYGWGGAMGPAQFIPSTWVCYGGLINTRTGDCNNESRSLGWSEFWQGPWEYKASKDTVRKFTSGDDPSNPWKPEDAIMASAILLSQNGADKGTKDSERLAALRYFAGWKNARDPSYAFYGDDVMELTEKYQKQIDVLKKEE